MLRYITSNRLTICVNILTLPMPQSKFKYKHRTVALELSNNNSID